jgi:hypothetical protein
VTDSLNFPQRFGLICRLWEIQPSSKAMRTALKVNDPSVLNRWASFITQKADTQKHSDSKLIPLLVTHLDTTDQLRRRGYSAGELRRALAQYDDKKFLQFLAARSLPASVRELSQPKYDQLYATLLGDSTAARYLMYRLGTFEVEDLPNFSESEGRAFLAAKVPVLRRVPVSFETLLEEMFLLYREAYRIEHSIGSVFHVDTHFTIWGQDDNNNTSELFLITIKKFPIPSGPFHGLFSCAILMLGDGDNITACKALLRRLPDRSANMNSAFVDFAREMGLTIVLRDETPSTGYQVETASGVEPDFDIKYEDYADFLSIKSERHGAIILR